MVQIGRIEDEDGFVKSIGRGTDYSYTLDDRQELVQTVNGAVAVDGWNGARFADGDVVACKCTFTKTDAETVRSWWARRVKKKVTLDNGEVIDEARILVRQIGILEGFWTGYQSLSLEFWKV